MVAFLLSVLQFLGILFLVLLVFNLMIVVHELGHFLAARWRGLRVDKFQIWFGRCIWKKTVNGVQYGLGTIPAGGFVMLPQMAMEAIEGPVEDADKLPPVKPVDKIIVAFAGPLFSFLLAAFFAVVVWIVKYPESKASNSTTIGFVLADSPAEKAGLRPGDVVKRIDGQPVLTFMGMSESIQWAVMSSKDDELSFEIERGGVPMTVPVVAAVPKIPDSVRWYQRLFLRSSPRQAGLLPASAAIIVGEVMEQSPAEEAGLKVGDRLMAMDGGPLLSFATLSQHVSDNAPDLVRLSVLRDGQALDLDVRPRIPVDPGDYDPDERRIGVKIMADDDARMPKEFRDNQLVRVSPLVQLARPLKSVYQTLTAVTSPGSGVNATHLSGAPMIVYIYYRLFENPDGWRLVLWFSVFLNVSLAVMNLMPLPVLDGGHITMSLYEIVARRPVPAQFLKTVYSGCALLLIGFMLFIAGFDVRDIFEDVSSRQKKPYSFVESAGAKP
jgi:regulator of sigma E protease